MADARCAHNTCLRPAAFVVGMDDQPNALNQTHDCCGHHRGCGRA